MNNRKRQEDPYIGIVCGDDYKIEEKIGQGKDRNCLQGSPSESHSYTRLQSDPGR